MTMRLVRGVYIADTARVLGEVEIGRDTNVWYGAVIRGDVGRIQIGEATNLQDGVIVHCDEGIPNVIGSRVSIGHGAIVHCEGVGDGSLVGIGARILANARVGRGCLVAAGAVVPPGLQVPDGMVVMGVPARIVRPVTDEERAYLRDVPGRYVLLARLHHEETQDPRVRPWD